MPTTMITDRTTFLDELTHLEEKFASLSPELELTVRDSEMGVKGFVVVWNTQASIGGPLGRVGKGGTRITPSVHLDEIKMLSRIMTLKNAAAGLPLGGAKSGLVGNPDEPGFERKYRRFVEMVKPILKENGGIFGGFGFDLGARPEHVKWACDELGSLKSFTGKPVEMGGTDYDNEGIAGLGVVTAAKSMLEVQGRSMAGTTCAIQGLGAMGAAIFRYATEHGAKVIAIADLLIGGTFVFPDGIPETFHESIVKRDVPALQKLLAEGNYVAKSLDDVLYQKVDVLYPAAKQDVIDANTVKQVQAQYVVEAANNPLSPEARTYLYEHNVGLVPDFIANPGGIIAAFVEMSSAVSPEDNAAQRTNVYEAKAMTIANVTKSVRTMLDLSRRYQVEPSRAGMHIALTSIFGSGM
ncbi:MAG: Glu/Leu/Phe/Val family dehydrogenase [Candidatus Dormibacteria bacterium]